MDIFKEVATRKTIESRHERSILKRSMTSFSEGGHRSDTDSGRSSDVENRRYNHSYATAAHHGTSKQSVAPQEPPPRHVSDLKVRRERPIQKFHSLPRPTQPMALHFKEPDLKVDTMNRKHPVVRRIAEAARKRDFRRNTIDVTVKDLELAEAVLNEGKLQSKNLSKSTNHIDRIGSCQESFEQKIDALNFESNKNGVSLPDLSVQKLYVLPELKVRRHRSVRDDVNNIMALTKDARGISKGPEFIANAALPAKQLDISDAKVCSFTVHFVHLLF